MKALWKLWINHGTKALGFIQVTLGVLAATDGFFEPRTVKLILIGSGLATAWRGFFNSAQNAPPPP